MVFIILLSLAFLTHTKRLNPFVAGLFVESVQIVCYILLITVKNAVAKYIFVITATAASQSFYPLLWPGKSALLSVYNNWHVDASIKNVSERPKERPLPAWRLAARTYVIPTSNARAIKSLRLTLPF